MINIPQTCGSASAGSQIEWLARRGGLCNLKGICACQVEHPGPGGITPLHLAALQNDDGQAARLVAGYCGAEAWTASLTWDGLSPSDFSRRMGLHAIDQEIRMLAAAEPEMAAGSGDDSAEGRDLEMEAAEEGSEAAAGQFVLEMGADAANEAESEVQLLLGSNAPRVAAESCVLWPGPLAPIVPAGLASKWSNVALLGVAACLCTCVVLLRDWM